MPAPAVLPLALQALAGLSWLAPAASESFLATPAPNALRGGPQEPRRGMLPLLERKLGDGYRRAAEARMGRLEGALRPTFASLAKNAHGAVSASSARYALHRLFVQLHGWQLKGLDPSGARWAGVSLIRAFGDRVPGELHELFEEHLSSRGFDLHELAVVAAMLEHMVHGEAEGRLQSIYKALGRSKDLPLDEDGVNQVIDAYMASYILGANASSMSREKLWQFTHSIQGQHPNWPETKLFLREVRHDVRAGLTSFTFNDAVAVVEEAADRFGRWQGKECIDLKSQLAALEDSNGTGRVRLADFYASALHGGKWQFSETVEYLRQLGAIDDTEPSGPRVIIPNYIYSPSNCLASSSFYAVCCIDECEELLGHLEGKLKRPTATPEEIIELVSALPSASVPANRTLAPGLIQRLTEVGQHHGGQVPLHGRLFAQWMHHAYPRECPYPHVSGTTKPQRPEEWEASAGQDVTATEDEMVQHIEQGKSRRTAAPSVSSNDGMCSAMWTMEEELVDMHAQKAAGGCEAAAAGHSAFAQRVGVALRIFALLAAAGSLLLALAKALGPACCADESSRKSLQKLQRYSV